MAYFSSSAHRGLFPPSESSPDVARRLRTGLRDRSGDFRCFRFGSEPDSLSLDDGDSRRARFGGGDGESDDEVDLSVRPFRGDLESSESSSDSDTEEDEVMDLRNPYLSA